MGSYEREQVIHVFPMSGFIVLKSGPDLEIKCRYFDLPDFDLK